MNKAGLVFLAAAWCLSAPAQNLKLAVVDIERVILESEAGKKMQQDMDAFLKQARADVSVHEQALEKLNADIQQAQDKEAELADLQRRFEDTRMTLARVREDKTREMKEMESNSLELIEAELVPVMEAFTKAEGVEILLNTRMESLVWSDPVIDITEKIIAAYNSARSK